VTLLSLMTGKRLWGLRKQSTESIADPLVRLNLVIATAQSTGQRVDEINTPSSNLRYEL